MLFRSRFLREGAIVLALLATLGCSTPNEYQAPPPKEVTVANPVARSLAEVVEFTGSCDASERVELRARVKGFLDSYHYVEGEAVEAGAKLFVIDPKPFEADLAGAQAALSLSEAEVQTAKAAVIQAQARAANAEAQLRRALQAAQGGAVTEAELDDMRTQRSVALADYQASQAGVLSAEAQVKVAQAAVVQANLDLSYTVVAAPIAGRVSRRQVDVGNLVGANEATLLAQIVKYDPVHVYFTVTEREFLEHIRRRRAEESGAEGLTLREKEIPIRVGLEGEEGFPHLGKLDYAGVEIDQSTGTYPLRAELDNPKNLIPSGAYARVQVSGEVREVLLVNDEAIGRSPTGAFVMVVDSDNKCQRRGVKLGRLVDGMREVLGGLTTADRVVVDGLQRARPGVEVKPIKAEPPAGEKAEGVAPPPDAPDSPG